MGLETATYINGLVTSNPDGTDAKSQGDDHLRLIKSVLKNSFPNITGAVTATQDDLNKTAIVGNFCFPGMIVAWSGSIGTIPVGWKVCNGVGTISTGAAVPDLRGRFLWGTDGTVPNPIGYTFGTADINLAGSVSGTALALDQIPNHSHQVGVNTWTPVGLDQTGGDIEPRAVMNYPGSYSNWATSAVGSGNPHTHSFTISAPLANLPPAYALAFLIKN